jgi:hypothetical protein
MPVSTGTTVGSGVTEPPEQLASSTAAPVKLSFKKKPSDIYLGILMSKVIFFVISGLSPKRDLLKMIGGWTRRGNRSRLAHGQHKSDPNTGQMHANN